MTNDWYAGSGSGKMSTIDRSCESPSTIDRSCESHKPCSFYKKLKNVSCEYDRLNG